jgi:hypothetical protein
MTTTVNKTIEQIVYEGIDKMTAVSKQGADSVKQMRQALEGVKNVLGALGVTVGAGALVHLHYQALQATAALDDMAERSGASVEGLSAIQRVTKVGGQDMEGFTAQLGRTVKGLKDGTEEGNKSVRAFAAVGISAFDARGRMRDMSEVVVELAKQLQGYADDGTKVQLVQDALGKGAEHYLPLLKDLADDTDRHATVTREQAAAAEQAEKNINRLKLVMEDNRRELVNSLTPAIVEFTSKLLEAARASGGLVAGLATMATADTGRIRERLAEIRREIEIHEKAMERPAAGLGNKLLNALQAPSDAASKVRIGRLMAEQDYLERLERARLSKLTEGMVQDPSGEILPAPAQPRLNYRPPDEGAAARAQREAEFVARQQQEGLEEEQRIQAEAWHWTAFYANKKLETTKATEQARIQALIDAHDREQELAIEQGEILAASPSYSAKAEALRQELMTEEELEIESHRKRLERLAEFSDTTLEDLGGRQAVLEQMEQEHQNRLYSIRSRGLTTLAAFNKASWQQQTATIVGELANMTAGVSRSNRTLFELNKVAGIANAIVNAYTGISRTLGAYPYPWNIAMAAAHAVAAFAQVQAIQSATFGGGAPAPSIAGSTPATPVTPVESAAPAGRDRSPTTIIHLHGTTDELKVARRLVAALNENSRDGGRIVLVD